MKDRYERAGVSKPQKFQAQGSEKINSRIKFCKLQKMGQLCRKQFKVLKSLCFE